MPGSAIPKRPLYGYGSRFPMNDTRSHVSLRRRHDRCEIICRGHFETGSYQKLLEAVELCLEQLPERISFDLTEMETITRSMIDICSDAVSRCLSHGVAVEITSNPVAIRTPRLTVVSSVGAA